MAEQLKSPRSIIRLKALKQVNFQRRYEKSDMMVRIRKVQGTKSPAFLKAVYEKRESDSELAHAVVTNTTGVARGDMGPGSQRGLERISKPF